MTMRHSSTLALPEFEHLLDVFGGDRTRWPLGVRASAAALLASDSVARQLLAEAVALDAVLAEGDCDGQADTARLNALASRIMTAAAATPRMAMVNAAPVSVRNVELIANRSSRDSLWRAATMLAASLVLGVFVGQSQLGADALPKLAAAAGLSLVTAERLALADIELDATEVD